MTGLLGRLFAVAEAYPELKANTNFLQLQDQLANIEGELQSARRYYNATVRDLNSTIQSFPPVLVARPARVQRGAVLPGRRSQRSKAPRKYHSPVRRPDDAALAAGPPRARSSLVASTAAAADERILRYVSDVQIQRTARSRSPRRSTSTSSTTASTTASIATSRPAIAGGMAAQMHVGFTFEGATLDGAAGAARTPSPRATASASRSAIQTGLVDVGEHSLRPPLSDDSPDRPLPRLSTSSTGTRPATAGSSRSTSPRHASACPRRSTSASARLYWTARFDGFERRSCRREARRHHVPDDPTAWAV